MFLFLLKVLQVVEQSQADVISLFRLFNEHTTSDSVVQYLRLLTSAHLQNNADYFRNFVEAPDLHVYCHEVGIGVAAIYCIKNL